MTSDKPTAIAVDSTSQQELIDVLVQATFMTMAVLSSVAAENDLSLTQLRVLAILRDRRVRMSALAAHLGLDKSTMTGLVDRAEQRGLLTRAASADDGRAIEVFLSPSGAGLAATLQPRIVLALTPATGRLNPAERDRLSALLQRMIGS